MKLLGYVELLRAHIYKENNILIPMADSILSAGAQAGALSPFAARWWPSRRACALG